MAGPAAARRHRNVSDAAVCRVRPSTHACSACTSKELGPPPAEPLMTSSLMATTCSHTKYNRSGIPSGRIASRRRMSERIQSSLDSHTPSRHSMVSDEEISPFRP
eukprot:scaffold18965_cov33-Tisochrysis_lutea.AAC.3